MIGVGERFPEFSLQGVSGYGEFGDQDADHDFIQQESWSLEDWLSLIHISEPTRRS